MLTEMLTFGSHCSANFQPILDFFIPKFKLEYNDLENIKTDRVKTVVFNLHQMKQSKFFFLGHPVRHFEFLSTKGRDFYPAPQKTKLRLLN